MEQVLSKEFRNGILECNHRGHIVCVDSRNNLKYAVGDENFLSFYRSSAKPISAISIAYYGLIEKFGFTKKEVALMCASHLGQDEHVETALSILEKIELKEEDLFMIPQFPIYEPSKLLILKGERNKRKLYHNCSGKHLGFLSLCKFFNWDIKGYWEINHPLQREVIKFISLLSSVKQEDIKLGIDGCGVPVFAVPMRNQALSFARLADPYVLDDDKLCEAILKITDAMNDSPLMISGTGRICTVLNGDKNIVAKGGARGVYTFGLKKEKLGFSLKSMEGMGYWPIVIPSILEQIQYDNKEIIENIKKISQYKILNDNELEVGEHVPSFKL